MLSCLNELMSMNIPYSGLLCTCFCFSFGTFACLTFACAHTSHGSRFPVILIPMFSSVVLEVLSSASSYLMQFPYWNTFSRFYNHMCLTASLCVFIPISHDDPDGIILSNVILNHSTSFLPSPIHLPSFFMALVKLKRSWFN